MTRRDELKPTVDLLVKELEQLFNRGDYAGVTRVLLESLLAREQDSPQLAAKEREIEGLRNENSRMLTQLSEAKIVFDRDQQQITHLTSQLADLKQIIQAANKDGLTDAVMNAVIERNQLQSQLATMREALADVTAHLIAASDLLKAGGRKAAPSNKMFEQMLNDYAKSICVGKSALQAHAAQWKEG